MRIGVLGGSFDPIHIGHLIIAEEARTRLSLERVIFVPAALQWLKKVPHAASPEGRLEMVRLAVASHPAFEVSDVEVRRPGPSYTVDTLALLQDRLGPAAELFFILGLDSLAELPQWHEPQRLLQLCRLVAVPRPGEASPDMGALEGQLPGLRARLVTLEGAPGIAVSSSVLRARLARGESVRYLVPEAVEEYIRREGLYRPGATAPAGS